MDGPNVKLGPFFKFMAYYKLSEILTLIGGGTPKTTNPSYWGGNIPWLSVVDFNNDNRYVHTTEKTITEEGVQNSSTKILPQGSLILSARGTVGALAQLTKPMAFNQSCYGIIAKEQTTNDFLYYLLKDVVEDLQAKGHGSVFNTITRDTFDTITVNLPSLDEQKRIAEILGSLDDKIELLQKQNKTLEDMAKALFKSWFVDFDVVRAKQKGLPKADIMREYHLTEELYDLFPSSFADSPLGPIPTGWEVKPLGAFFPIRTGKKDANVASKEGSYPFFSCAQNVLWTNEYSFDETALLLAGNGDFNLKWYRGKFEAYQRTYVLIPNEKQDLPFLYYAMQFFLDKITLGSRGSVIKFITKGMIANYKLVIPEMHLWKSTGLLLGQWLDKIEMNNKEIQTLTELRDSLLPRLISGKLRV